MFCSVIKRIMNCVLAKLFLFFFYIFSFSKILIIILLYVMVNPQLMMSALLRFLVAQWFFVNNSLNWFFGQSKIHFWFIIFIIRAAVPRVFPSGPHVLDVYYQDYRSNSLWSLVFLVHQVSYVRSSFRWWSFLNF